MPDEPTYNGGDHWKSVKQLVEDRAVLLAALKGAVADLEQTLTWYGGWECSEEELLGEYRAAILQAETSPHSEAVQEEGL